ncbi:MAG: hypothetical protein ACFFCW_08165 [Candidatus Hodarchaeota archaeon]
MNQSTKLSLIILFFSNFIYVSNANTATINASTCSRADVQSAINSASNGDTVIVPSGTCTWSSSVSIPSTKGITLKGAGIDSTTIRFSGNKGLKISGSVGRPFRVTGFTFTSLSGNEYQIYIDGDCRNWRIDHIKFNDNPVSMMPYGVWVHGHTYGVIDNCQFISIGQAVFVQEPDESDPVMYGDISWQTAIDWGGPKAVYVEDCTFTGLIDNQEQVFDGRYGGRIVFRYNTVTDAWIEPHSGCPNGGRAVMHNEIYENIFIQSDSGMWMPIRIRGGTGVIFNNDFDTDITFPVIFIDNQRSAIDCMDPPGECDGNNPLDGNTPGWYGWPCLDQIGRGANQSSNPMYEWNNEKCANPPCDGGGTDVDIHIFELGGGLDVNYHLIENRDFYNDTQKPGYTPYIYPHPLRTNGDTMPPAPPTGVRVIK